MRVLLVLIALLCAAALVGAVTGLVLDRVMKPGRLRYLAYFAVMAVALTALFVAS